VLRKHAPVSNVRPLFHLVMPPEGPYLMYCTMIVLCDDTRPHLSCARCDTGSHALVLWRPAHGLQKCEWSYFKLAVCAETTIFTGFRQSDAPNLIWAVAAPRYVASDWPLSESSTGGSMARLVSAEMVRSPGPPYTSNIRPYYHGSTDTDHLDSGGGPAPHAPHVMARYLLRRASILGVS
jgi:hypothetical protein